MAQRVHRTLAAYAEPIRLQTYRGREHVVVPVVAMVGGAVVRPMGAGGRAEYVPAEELAKAPGGWNGSPVIEDHPVNSEGEPISVNTPELRDAMEFGQVFNARFEGGRLKMDAFLDPEAAGRVGEAARAALEAAANGEKVEVSVGAVITSEQRAGVSPSGEAYDAIWRDPVPDHLAVGLGGKKGACSVEDGCGTRAAKGEDMADKGKFGTWLEKAKALFSEVEQFTSDAEPDPEPVAAEEGDKEPTTTGACSCSKPNGDDPQGGTMSKIKELVAGLIASAASPFTDEDKERLEAFGEDRLTAMAAHCEPAEPAPEPVKAAAEPEKAKPEGVTLSAEEYAEMKAASDAHKASEAKAEAELRAAVIAVHGDEAKDWTLDQLRVARSVLKIGQPKPDYSGQGLPDAQGKAGSLEDHMPPDPYAEKEAN